MPLKFKCNSQYRVQLSHCIILKPVIIKCVKLAPTTFFPLFFFNHCANIFFLLFYLLFFSCYYYYYYYLFYYFYYGFVTFYLRRSFRLLHCILNYAKGRQFFSNYNGLLADDKATQRAAFCLDIPCGFSRVITFSVHLIRIKAIIFACMISYNFLWRTMSNIPHLLRRFACCSVVVLLCRECRGHC
jgi:hypothetical protein